MTEVPGARPQRMLYIVADENIPLAAELFGAYGTVQLVPGSAITPALVRGADVLLVRSVTRVDEALIAGSRLRFVGSATIGTDHVDTAALAAGGIPFHHAPGSNADSVVEYVIAALLVLCVRNGRALRGLKLGIVGCGNIGSRLAQRLPALGARVLLNDPPLASLAEQDGVAHPYLHLERILSESDAVTLHVPLVSKGTWPTHHLLDAAALQRMQPAAWLLNTSRGSVVSGAALRETLSADAGRRAVLDVWEHEPDPDPLLIERCALATPHIAGYSWDGKVTGVRMLHAALVRELGLDATELGTLATDGHAMPAQQAGADALPNDSAGIRDNDAERIRLRPVTSAGPGPGVAPDLTETQWLHGVVKQMYDIEADDARMRVLLSMAPRQRAREFRELRRSYPVRRTFSQHVLSNRDLPAPWREQVTKGLQVSVH